MSTSLEIGILGLPNVGKTTLFNALTKAGVETNNCLYSTVEPAMLIRQSGMAEGVEQFIKTITKHPTQSARPDRT